MRCPVTAGDVSHKKDRSRRKSRTDHRTRERLPVLPAYGGHVAWVTDVEGEDAVEIAPLPVRGGNGGGPVRRIAAGLIGRVQELSAAPDGRHLAVAASDGRAITVGEKGLVRVSTDGGESWGPPGADSFPEVFTFMRDLGFEHDRQVGFIVGQQGLVLRSKDGGRTWARVLPKGEGAGLGRLL